MTITNIDKYSHHSLLCIDNSSKYHYYNTPNDQCSSNSLTSNHKITIIVITEYPLILWWSKQDAVVIKGLEIIIKVSIFFSKNSKRCND